MTNHPSRAHNRDVLRLEIKISVQIKCKGSFRLCVNIFYTGNMK